MIVPGLSAAPDGSSEDRVFRALCDAAPVGIFLNEPAGRTIYVNPSLERLARQPVSKILGGAWLEAIHPEDRSRIVAAATASSEAGRDYDEVARYLHADGKIAWWHLRTAPVRLDGRLLWTIGIVEDETQRHQAGEAMRHSEAQLLQAQKMEAVGRLAGGVAHDFNNLLNVITGYAELLTRELPADHKGQARIEQVRRAAERAAQLTRRLLMFSRKQVVEAGPLDLNTVIGDMEAMLRRLIGEDMRLVFSPAPDLWPVLADAGQMEQVVMNLAVNARDAMPRGGRVVVETANVTRPGPDFTKPAASYVQLKVSDTGTGMDGATMSRIFEPFFTTKAKDKGTGLGLAMVFGIVQQAGGTIDVASAPGEGATFLIHLPRAASASAPAAEKASVAPPSQGQETILIVEDEAALREMVGEILVEAGYTVIEASGPEAAERIGTTHLGPIHLVLTDVVMPGASGQAVADQLRQERPTTRVLYMSGYSDESISTERLNPGTLILAKPFTTEALLRAVRGSLDEA